VPAPTPVFEVGPALVELNAGGGTTCGISGSGEGTTFCWGRNDHGQCGSGSALAAQVTLPVMRPTPGFAALDVGPSITCAIQQGLGAVWCWGANRGAVLGAGDAGIESRVPVLRIADARAAAVAVGGSHVCFVRRGAPDVVRCFGARTLAQTGAGLSDVHALQPDDVPLPGVTTVDEIAAGESFSCARAGEQVWCWGEDFWLQSSGTQGDGGAPDSAVRVDAVVTPNPVVRVFPVRVPLPG
jgi:alpha-tubulin suppressor-like RCC1 family protein